MATLGLLAAFPQLRPPRRWFTALLALWITVGFGAATWPRHHDRLDCTFLSMGHGCAVLLELPSGQTILYDAGQSGAPTIGSRTIAECLWQRGMRRLDAVVLSHPDLDHYNALPGLLDKFSVGAVYVSSLMFQKKNEAVAELKKAIERHRIAVREVRSGDRLRTGGGPAIEVLHPPRFGVLGSDNANSVVLAVDYCGREILLPGDLESPGLDDLLAEEPRRCDVLLAPHHGSRQSNSPELAKWCMPRCVIISGDGRWDSPEVAAPYRALGAACCTLTIAVPSPCGLRPGACRLRRLWRCNGKTDAEHRESNACLAAASTRRWDGSCTRRWDGSCTAIPVATAGRQFNCRPNGASPLWPAGHRPLKNRPHCESFDHSPSPCPLPEGEGTLAVSFPEGEGATRGLLNH